jgi:glutathione synthase/RimK-type ligase-like ATP-grasp enzyme
MHKVIIVDNPETWKIRVAGMAIVSSGDYLTNPDWAKAKNLRVFNLCKSYSYQSKGYYVSLLAEARGHKPIPTVRNILDVRKPFVVKLMSEEMDGLIQRRLKDLRSDEFTLSVYFGRNLAEKYDDLSNLFYRSFRVPFLRVRFVRSSSRHWHIQSVKTISAREIPENHFPFVLQRAEEYFSRKRYDGEKTPKHVGRYAMAILYREDDPAPPSDKKAIQKFVRYGEKAGFDVDVISVKDYSRLLMYDALFIRQNTHVNNETYQFAHHAQREGIALLDYPESILKINNKVYLAELLQSVGVATPKTMIVHRRNRHLVESTLNLPCVLKLPDSTFSFGVKKAATSEELDALIDSMLKKSELLIAQEFCFTEFDWRIGILDGEPLFACKYLMAKDHWQIFNWDAKKHNDVAGGFEGVRLDEVPPQILKIARRSVKPIGRGLYGIDIKVVRNRPMVIEINENPNIDEGVEDLGEGDIVYRRIIDAFLQRIAERTGGGRTP